MKDKLDLANELASRKVDSDCGENLAIYVPFDNETRAILTKLGYSENEKFPVFDDLIDITFVANDIFPDGNHWSFDGEKFIDFGDLKEGVSECECLDCYWNSSCKDVFHPVWEGTKWCLSDEMVEHLDINNPFKLTPGKKTCPGYSKY